MDFLQAVKVMKEGKKVRREIWDNKEFQIRLDIEIFKRLKYKDVDGADYIFTVGDFEATDWQLVEDKKTLSDRGVKSSDIVKKVVDWYEKELSKHGVDIESTYDFKEDTDFYNYPDKYVKEAIKRIINLLKAEGIFTEYIEENIKELLGERLTWHQDSGIR